MRLDPLHTVLVVDEGETYRRNLKQMLRTLGAKRISEASGVSEAWYAVNDENVQLVICNWDLAEGTGLELLQKLKWSEDFSRIPFIMTTDTDDEERIEQAMQLAVSDYVVRPVTDDVLAYKIEKIGNEEGGAAPGEADGEGVVLLDPGRKAPNDEPSSAASAAPPGASPDIADIIRHKKVRTLFQPILSIGDRSILGFEALTRGFVLSEGEEISPAVLFDSGDPALTLALDRVCREKALESFAALARKNARFSLGLNVDASNFLRDELLLDDVQDGVERYGLDPSRIVLEFCERDVAEDEAVERFMRLHRERGFKVAFERISHKHLSFERILTFVPDVIKLDRNLVDGVDSDPHRRDAVKAIMNLCRRIGTRVVATGIERKDEALALLECGVEHLQGYYFDRPLKKDIRGIEKYLYQVQFLGYTFVKYAQQRILKQRSRQGRVISLSKRIVGALSNTHPDRFERILAAAFDKNEDILGLYVLDIDGVQVTGAVTRKAERLACAGAGKPPAKGSRHFLRDYYLHVKAGYSKFVTPSYVSSYTCRRCRTIARPFDDAAGKRFIVCIDIEA